MCANRRTSKKRASYLGKWGHRKLEIARLFEAIGFFPPFAQRKRLGKLTISAITPITSYFTVHKGERTVKISWVLKTSPEYEITGNVLNIFVQWHTDNCADMSNLNKGMVYKMNISVYLNTWCFENRFQMQNINCRLKSSADFMASQNVTEYF